MFSLDDLCHECEEFTAVSRTTSDPKVYEYYCRNRECGARWVEQFVD